MTDRILLTSGEPAGIGPDVCIEVAQQSWPCELIIAGDPEVLERRAHSIGKPVRLRSYHPGKTPVPHVPGMLACLEVKTATAVRPGTLDPANSAYVLSMLDAAATRTLQREFAAVVTAPVHKGVINDAGHAFSGHTEYFAERTGTQRPVMMLAAGMLRVALATTHLPLARVSAAITRESLSEILDVLHRELRTRFRLADPRILVCGLNPHAGESGHLGHEEIDTLIPVLEAARAAGMRVIGPVPADTAFVPRMLAQADAVLAMYHDQGLPVLKHAGFGHAVNVTLGLPIVRTSVDHGTALDLAGSGDADAGSLAAALRLAIDLARRT